MNEPSALPSPVPDAVVEDRPVRRTPGHLRPGGAASPSGSPAEAHEIYQQILRGQPEHAGALHLAGLVRSQQGRHTKALELIGRAIAKDPRQSVYFNNYGAALHAMGRYVEALACFHRGLGRRSPESRNPGNPGESGDTNRY